MAAAVAAKAPARPAALPTLAANAPLRRSVGATRDAARWTMLQRQSGNQAVLRRMRAESIAATAPRVDRLSLSDVVPDAILEPIRALLGQSTEYGSGVTAKSEAANASARAGTDVVAAQADGDAAGAVATQQAVGQAAAGQATQSAAVAEAAARAGRAGGQAQVEQFGHALPAAEYATDPVRPVVSAPPPGSLPGTGAVAAPGPAGQTWDCDEASVVGAVSTVGKKVIQGLTTAVRAVVPDRVLRFAERGIAELQSVVGGIRQKVDAARQAVTKWIDGKLAPVRAALAKAEAFVGAKVDAAKAFVSSKVSQLTQWAAAKWESLKTRAKAAVDGAIDWAKQGASGLLERGRSLAGRFWNLLPDAITGPITRVASTLAAPFALAYKGVTEAASWIETKAAAARRRLAALADSAARRLAAQYQAVRTRVAGVGHLISEGASWVRDKAAAAGKKVYERLDALSGGRLSKWRAAAAARFAALKGDVCAITGEVAGPCVERFVPEPSGAEGKGFASLTTKADVTVPIEGVPVKVAAGAKVTIERTAKTYKVILAGDGSAGVAVKLSGGGGSAGASGGGGASGSVAVDGTLPNRAIALLSLSGRKWALPSVPLPFGAAPKPAAAPAPVANAPGTSPAVAGGGGLAASAEAGVKVSVALTYAFDATADKSSCDGLGGLTAFLASQGAAALLPQPFSHLAAAGGQAAFADHLTSAKMTYANVGSVSVKGGGDAKGSAGIKAESGASLEAKVDKDKNRLVVLTLFQGLTGEAAVEFAPGGIGLGKVGASLGGRQELGIEYNLTLDKLDASIKQALSGSVTVAGFAGLIDGLPGPIRDALKRRIACLPNATEASVSFELSNNIQHLQALAAALDAELSKGDAASADGLWQVVAGFVRDKNNAFVEFSAKLTLTEKVLGAKGSLSADGVSVGAEIGIARGQEIVLCPPTKLFQGGTVAFPDGPLCGEATPQVVGPTPPKPGVPLPSQRELEHPEPGRRPPAKTPGGGRAAAVDVGAARKQVQESAEQIKRLVRERQTASPADQARIDAEIAQIQKRRQAALMAVVLADNPNAEVVDEARGLYRVRMVDADGKETFLFGSLSVAWQLAQVSPSVFALGAQLQSVPPTAEQLPPGTTVRTQMGVGGSGIQGQAQPFPGDIDFAENFEISAPDAQSAALAAYETIVGFVRRNAARKDIEFQRLIITGGQPYTLAMLQNDARKDQLVRQLANLKAANGNVNTFWRARVDGGRFIEVTKILSIHALSTTSGDSLFSTRESGAEFQQASFEEPGQIPSTNLGGFAEIMRTQAIDLLAKGKFLKAAKRGFNFCMVTGNLAGMAALKPVFATEQAQVNQQTAVLEAVSTALATQTPTRILRADEAQTLVRSAADAIGRLGGGSDAPRRIAADLRTLAGEFGATDQGLLKADKGQNARLAALTDESNGLLNSGLSSVVTAAIDKFVR